VSAPHGNGGYLHEPRPGSEMKLTLPFKGFDLASSQGFDIGVSH
jgi:hypothetical protein